MTEHLDGARREIESRLTDLRDEVKRLEAAAAALGTGRRVPRRGRGKGRRGRPRGSGTRAAQAERLVRENPGINIAELARKMSIKPNYLYRVMPELQKDGKVRKRGKGWHPA